MALSAQVCARVFAASASTSAPTLPVAAREPSTIGSWPEVKTRLPSRTTGTYAATGGTTSGTVRPSSARRSSTADTSGLGLGTLEVGHEAGAVRTVDDLHELPP